MFSNDNQLREQLDFAISFISSEKQNNKVHYMQEGPSWWFNDYEIMEWLGGDTWYRDYSLNAKNLWNKRLNNSCQLILNTPIFNKFNVLCGMTLFIQY